MTNEVFTAAYWRVLELVSVINPIAIFKKEGPLWYPVDSEITS